LEEVLHVFLAYTVVDPGAVVVHLEHAETAFAAVMGSLWLPGFFADTLFAVLNLQVLTLERRSHTLRDATRVCKSGS